MNAIRHQRSAYHALQVNIWIQFQIHADQAVLMDILWTMNLQNVLPVETLAQLATMYTFANHASLGWDIFITKSV